jgi:PAS domain S-box-containing protein
MAQMLGLSSTEGVVIPPEQWPSLIHPEDFARATGALEATITQNKVLSEIYRVRRQDGEYRWTANKGQLIHNREGKPVTVLGVTEDITEAKQAEARQRLLIAELDHRVKNTLATVQSVAQQSLGKGPQTDSFVGRIAALAKAHSLLAETQWKGASLHALITRQFGPYTQENPKRVTFDGPNLLLDARTTQSLCFILHELTTNAAKYGALSQPSGRVHIQWQIEDETAPIVHLTWREEGIEGVTPPSRQGFGTTLIQSSVAHELNGTLHMNFTAMGLLCEISFPLPALQIAPREQAEPAAAKSKPSADRHGARGKRILIVEDSVLVALDIEGQLRDNGAVPVGPAYMLETAMSLAREEQLDAALLDVNISGRTIFPVAQILRARNIPFIFLSGYGEPDIWPAEWRGYDRLSKPIQSGELSEALDALFMQAHAIS